MNSVGLHDGNRNGGNASVQKILVTGAAGFIGSHLCERLLGDGHRVWGLDNFDEFYAPAQKRHNLQHALDHEEMYLVEGDVRDTVLLDGLMSDVKFDAIVHLAARPGAEPSVENPEATFDVNVGATLTLLAAASRHGIQRLVYASSDDVYGDQEPPPYREDMPADRPLSPYAASKRAGEMICHVYHHLHDLTVHCLRLTSVFGPRQRPDLVIDEFAHQLEEGRSPELHAEDGSMREYTYVDDAVDGIVLSLERTLRRNGQHPEYSVINLGGAEAVDLGDLATRLSDAMLASTENRRSSGRTLDGDGPRLASVEKGRELLGYSPRVPLDVGLAEFGRWFRKSRSREAKATTLDHSRDIGEA